MEEDVGIFDNQLFKAHSSKLKIKKKENREMILQESGWSVY